MALDAERGQASRTGSKVVWALADMLKLAKMKQSHSTSTVTNGLEIESGGWASSVSRIFSTSVPAASPLVCRLACCVLVGASCRTLRNTTTSGASGALGALSVRRLPSSRQIDL